MFTMSAEKAEHNLKDMSRWAEYWGVPLSMPPSHPNRTVTAMRTVIAATDPVAAAKALFNAYWRDGRDVSDDGVVASALDKAGLDGARLVAAASDLDIKRALRENTEKAASLGAFGVPTFVIGGELIWGQDRMHLVEHLIR